MSRKFKKRLLNGVTHDHRSMPLIIPNDTTYDASTNELQSIPGVQRTSLKLVPETQQLLESVEKPLAVLAIGGSCRTGKSYVLSRILGSADDFALGHTMDAKTFGIWIGTTVLECNEFILLLMDTEGIDSANAKARDDASILVMTVLLSSYFIYNSIGVPKKNDLQKMSHFAKLATSIAIKDVSSPETFDLKNYFPDFLWLLRDAILTVPPGRDGKQMTPTDYLVTKVLKRGNSFEESTNDKIGRAILTIFPTIECITVQPPSADPEVMQDIVTKQHCLERRFNEQIDSLIKYLLQHVRAKNGFVEGNLVDGPLLVAMAAQFLKAVNSPDAIPCITDTWKAAVEMRCKKVLDKMVQEYTREMEAKITEIGLPMDEDLPEHPDPSKPRTLLGLHRLILLQKTEVLLKQVGHFISGPTEDGTLNRDSLGAKLEERTVVFSEEDAIQGQKIRKKKVVGGVLHGFVERNYRESRSHCLALFVELYMRVEEKMQTGDNYTFEMLKKDLIDLREKYYQRAIGPAKWDVYTEKESFIKSQEESYKTLRGFKKEAFDALQKAADEKAKNDQLKDSLDELETQMKNDIELNEKRVGAMQKQHDEEMQRLKVEQDERMESDRKKYEDFIAAKMDDMAEITKENREAMKDQYDVMFKAMEAMREQNQESLKTMNASVAAMTEAIKRKPRPTGPVCSIM